LVFDDGKNIRGLGIKDKTFEKKILPFSGGDFFSQNLRLGLSERGMDNFVSLKTKKNQQQNSSQIPLNHRNRFTRF
jgi:hypothetical protein